MLYYPTDGIYESLEFKTCFKLAILLTLFNFSFFSTKASIISGTSLSSKSELDIEVQTWITDDSNLPALETLVVKELQKHPNSSFYHYLLSHIYIRMFSIHPENMKYLALASELAEQSLQLDPSSEFGYLATADLLDLMGQTNQAQMTFEELRKKAPKDSWRMEFAKARLYAGTRSIEEISKILTTSLTLADSKPDIIVPYIVTLLKSNYNPKELHEILVLWNRKFPHPYFDLMAAINHTELGNYNKANQVYTKIGMSEKFQVEANLNKAVLLYQHLKNPKLARKILEKILTRVKMKRDYHYLNHIILAHLGAVNLKIKNMHQAQSFFIKSINQSNDQVVTIEFIIENYKTSNEFSLLAKTLVNIIDELPGQASLYALLGEIYSEKLKHFDKAAQSYENAIILDPQNGAYYTSLGLNQYHQQQFNAALESFDTAIFLNPGDSIALYNKACIYAITNQPKHAIIALNKAIMLNPHLQRAALEDEDFVNVKDLPHFRIITQEKGWSRAN